MKPAAVVEVLDPKAKLGRLKVLHLAARYMQMNGLLRRRQEVPSDCLGIQIAAPKVMSEETKAFLRGKSVTGEPKAPRKLGSGAFIRNLLATTKLTEAQIVEKVHAEFPGSKATVKDVVWNRRQLKK